MTGFGRAAVEGKRMRYVVEARSVNSRYCDVRVQSPKDMLQLEHEVVTLVRGTFLRGKFDLVLRFEPLQATSNNGLDEKAIVSKWKQLERLRKKMGIHQPVPLEIALNWHVESNGHSPDPEAQKLFLQATKDALAKLQQFRKKEGQNLVADIASRGTKILKVVKDVSAKVIKGNQDRVQRMRDRLEELLAGRKEVDRAKIESEIGIMVERADVTEEIVRLQSHVKRLFELVRAKKGVGRELDFLVQELNREINTIGAKSADLGITSDVIFVKSEIEKIREQAQNLE